MTACPYPQGWTADQANAIEFAQSTPHCAIVMEPGSGKTDVFLTLARGGLCALFTHSSALYAVEELAAAYPDLNTFVLRDDLSLRGAIRAARSGEPALIIASYRHLSTNALEPFECFDFDIVCIDEHVLRNAATVRMAALARLQRQRTMLLAGMLVQNGFTDLVMAALILGMKHDLGVSMRDSVAAAARKVRDVPDAELARFVHELRDHCFFGEGGQRAVEEYCITGPSDESCASDWHSQPFRAICTRAARIQRDLPGLRRAAKKTTPAHAERRRRALEWLGVYGQRRYEAWMQRATAAQEALERAKTIRTALDKLITTERAYTPAVRALVTHYLAEQRGERRAVLVASSRKIQRGMVETARGLGLSAALLSSEMKAHQRRDLVARFQDGRYDVLVTGNFAQHGISLTAASDVVLFHQSTNPADTAQAVGRLARPGQQAETVRVFHLVLPNTFCGRIFCGSRVKARTARAMLEAVRADNYLDARFLILDAAELDVVCQLKFRALRAFHAGTRATKLFNSASPPVCLPGRVTGVATTRIP